MLRTKLERQIIAFVVIALASILLYPLSQAGMVTLTWALLGLIILAAILTLTTK
jgi:uncharacterized MnhB-related membrane protein